MIQTLILLAFIASLPSFHGPGALALADPGVLESVADRRARNGWGLDAPPDEGAVLIALADCTYLGREGWLLADDMIYPVTVVDCAGDHNLARFLETGLLADVNHPELNHRQGWLWLRGRE